LVFVDHQTVHPGGEAIKNLFASAWNKVVSLWNSFTGKAATTTAEIKKRKLLPILGKGCRMIW